jgi:phosphate transport system substrate-binding protein
MDKKNYATNILNLPATGAIVQAVGKLKALLVIGWHETKEVKQC